MCGIWCCIVLSQSSSSLPVTKTDDSKLDLMEKSCCPVCCTLTEMRLLCQNKEEFCNSKKHLNEEEFSSTGGRFSTKNSNYDKNILRMLEFSKRRGPDLSSEVNEECNSCIALLNQKNCTEMDNSEILAEPKFKHIHLSGNVLWTQGPQGPVAQPYINIDDTNYLLFNGDIYSFSGGIKYDDIHFSPDSQNDGLMFFNLLQEAINNPNLADICTLLGNIRGPYAFVYFDKLKNKIWFGRDFFGRESLLFSFYKDRKGISTYNISSVSVFEKVFEIPTAGIYELDLNKGAVILIPYSCHRREDVSKNLCIFSEFLESIGFSTTFSADFNVVKEKQIKLSFSTKLKSFSAEKCNVLMRLSELARIDSLSASEVLISATEILDKYVVTFLEHLRRSVRLRTKAISPYCKTCVRNWNNNTKKCQLHHPVVGVLFSGGLDSTVIAYLAIETLDSPVDLLNVAFSKNDNFNVPDRETALESFRVLKSIFEPQGKNTKLVLIDEKKETVVEMRRERVRELISPLKSVIDDSLGCCLWFAARGYGHMASDIYHSPVRTVLMGSGADELLGGYGRHRSAFERSGWEGLASEMQQDIDRISIRNMGRDNRVVSDHGVCPRMPFLDEAVVNFLTQECDVWIKCCPLLGSRGLGEKLLLRAAALKLFGKEHIHLALFPKRAMQFGSRIAKLEDSKEKGGDDCSRLK